MNKNLLILGAGQYGTVVKEIAVSMCCFEKISFLDDSFNADNSENKYCEKAIGKLEECENYSIEYSYAIVAIGNAEVRKQWTDRLVEAGFKIPVLVSSKAFVGRTAQLGYGVVVEPMAVVHENVLVGMGSFISAGAVVNHNSIVGSYCHIDNNAVVMRGAQMSSMGYLEPLQIARKEPVTHQQNEKGDFETKEISKRTPVGDGYDFDDVM